MSKKVKTELNPNALEFIPENKEKNTFKPIEKKEIENPDFDKLEKSFVKNNEWLFYI
jgi:hypothetical protein